MITRRRFGALAMLGGAALLPTRIRAQGDGTAVDTPSPETEQAAGKEGLLSDSRILSYYGFPGNQYMGILGQYSKEDLQVELMRQLEAYQEADPERPILPAFEMMVSVAQRDPMDDGSYLTYTGDDLIQEYVDFTGENDLQLILDAQFGRTTVQQEVENARKWLAYPHVHFALDAEFAVKEGETPGIDLGSLDASDVLYAQEEMVKIAEENDIPPKILILHQFNIYTVTNKEQIAPMDGVQFVLEVDGFGTPEEKQLTYSVMTENPIQFHGFKLWYSGEDDPLMTPADVLALNPSPDIIIYQ
jgi:hypothetical protein